MKKQKKVEYLDGLRGWAALTVVIDHWMMMGYEDPTTDATSGLWCAWFLRTPLRLLVDGGFAVAIFFTLSGYVLLARFFAQPKKTSIVYGGMVRRYPRLMIPALVSLLLYYSWLHFGPWEGFSGCHAVGEVLNDHPQNSTSAISFGAGAVLLNGLVGQWTYEPAIYTIQWTLQIELIASLAVYLLALGLTRVSHPVKLACYFVLVLIIPLLWWIDGYSTAPLPMQYLFSFIICWYCRCCCCFCRCCCPCIDRFLCLTSFLTLHI